MQIAGPHLEFQIPSGWAGARECAFLKRPRDADVPDLGTAL